MTTVEALKFKIEWYKKLKTKLEKILLAEMTVEAYDEHIYHKIKKLEEELSLLEDKTF